jgi:hypothetical protein
VITVGVKSLLATFIGLFQGLMGISAIVLAYLLYYNPDLFAVRTILNLQEAHIAFFMMVLFIVGFFATISGILVVYEWSSRS